MPPAPTVDLHEMDPTKHKIPATPVAGRLYGKPFTPDNIELEGGVLKFRMGKDVFSDQEIVVNLPNSPKSADSLKLVVRPSQEWGNDVPPLWVSAREGDKLPDTKFVNQGYAMTLELGKAEKGKVPGKLYLCLPDAQKSYLAGTFVATRQRSLGEPPGAEEVPYIQGSVSPAAKKGQMVWVGYVGQPKTGDLVSDGAGASAPDENESGGGTRSMSFKPRTASVRFEKSVAKFDFTNLPPGRYLVYARVKDGPAAWKWADVAADGKVTSDLTLDATKVGTVEVKLPADVKEARLVPTDLGTPAPSPAFVEQLGFSLDLKAEAKDGKATFTHVPVGKYQVRVGFGSDAPPTTVEVTVGKTATVELKPAKK